MLSNSSVAAKLWNSWFWDQHLFTWSQLSSCSIAVTLQLSSSSLCSAVSVSDLGTPRTITFTFLFSISSYSALSSCIYLSTVFTIPPWKCVFRASCTTSCTTACILLFCSLAILDPRVGHTMDILSPFTSCLLSFWLTLPQGVLSTSRCYPSRQCMVFLACVHLALFLALLSLNSSFVKNPLICFLCCPRNSLNLSQSFHLKGVTMCFILSDSPAFTAVHCYRPH